MVYKMKSREEKVTGSEGGKAFSLFAEIKLMQSQPLPANSGIRWTYGEEHRANKMCIFSAISLFSLFLVEPLNILDLSHLNIL